MQKRNSIYFYMVHENGAIGEFEIYSNDITIDSIIEALELLINIQ